MRKLNKVMYKPERYFEKPVKDVAVAFFAGFSNSIWKWKYWRNESIFDNHIQIKTKKNYEKVVNFNLLKSFDICKSIFACLFNAHNIINLSRYEQVCLMRHRFERCFSRDTLNCCFCSFHHWYFRARLFIWSYAMLYNVV